MALMETSSWLVKNRELQNSLFPWPVQNTCEVFAWEKIVAVQPQLVNLDGDILV